jgi:hypothetical protein
VTAPVYPDDETGGAQLLARTAAAALELYRCAKLWEASSTAMAARFQGDVPADVWDCSGLDAVMQTLICASGLVEHITATTACQPINERGLVAAWYTAAAVVPPDPVDGEE